MKETQARIKSAMSILVAVMTAGEEVDHFESRVLLNQIKRARVELQEAERICQQEIAGG